jgi:hypothetical protein
MVTSPLLQRLAEHLQAAAVELRQLVQEEHAVPSGTLEIKLHSDKRSPHQPSPDQ